MSNLSNAMNSTAVAIQAASNSVSSALGRREAKRQIEKDRIYNAEQAQIARDWSTSERLATQEFNLDMWNRNNLYNSPAEQLKRLKDAGINPNSMSGISPVASSPVTSSFGSASSASNSSGASYVNPVMSQMSNQLNSSLQNSLLEAQIQNVKADTDNKTYELTFNKLTEPQRYKLYSLQVDNLCADLGLKDADYRTKEETLKWLSSKNELDIDTMKQNLSNLREQNMLLVEQILKTKKESESIGQDVDNKELQNQLLALKLQFEQASGLPSGTKLTDASFYTWLMGEFPTVIDKATSTALQYAEEFPDRIIKTGKRIYKTAKDNVSRYFNGVKNYFNKTR